MKERGGCGIELGKVGKDSVREENGPKRIDLDTIGKKKRKENN